MKDPARNEGKAAPNPAAEFGGGKTARGTKKKPRSTAYRFDIESVGVALSEDEARALKAESKAARLTVGAITVTEARLEIGAITETKARLENREKTAYKPPDKPPIRREKDVGHVQGPLHDYLTARGVPESSQPKLAAKFDAIVEAEITGREAAPTLSATDLTAFKEHAASHQWNPESKPKVAPSAFIKKTFKDWLGRGLMLKHIRAAQKNLAGAYSTEIGRDPRVRIEGLGARTYTRHSKKPKTAPAVKVPTSTWIPVSELTEEQAAARREQQAATKRNARQHAFS